MGKIVPSSQWWTEKERLMSEGYPRERERERVRARVRVRERERVRVVKEYKDRRGELEIKKQNKKYKHFLCPAVLC